jgi:hypothetical protein
MGMANPNSDCYCVNDEKGTHTHLAADFHPGGMAQKVLYDQGGSRMRTGLSFVWPVCEDCGVLVADQERHDNYHLKMEKR